MQLIYPFPGGTVSRSKNWRGEVEPLVFRLAHPRPEQRVFWHLNGVFLATTTRTHELTADVPPGQHELVVTDDGGGRLRRRFTVR